ncbi:hypothetical protein ACA910_004784 [Epithemia clementina (nom. ined.)]
MGHSADQLRAAELTAKCTAATSILGSCSILYDILVRKSKSQSQSGINKGGGGGGASKQRTVMQILMGMSIFDIGASSMYLVGSWAIPSDQGSSNVFQPSGTDRTCVAQGFLFQLFASAIPMYNLSLALYSYLAVNRQWTEDVFRSYQWCFHVLPIGFGAITATYGLVDDQFHPNELWCWFSKTEQSDMLKFILYYGPLWLVFCIIVILFVLIYRHVRKIEQLIMNADAAAATSSSFSSQKKLETQTSSGGGGAPPLEEQAPSRPNEQEQQQQQQRKKKLRLSRAVYRQGVQFSCVFILTFLFPTITRSQQLHKESVRFGLLFMMTLFLPLQGFLNALVYFKAELAAGFQTLRAKLRLGQTTGGCCLLLFSSGNKEDEQVQDYEGEKDAPDDDDATGIFLDHKNAKNATPTVRSESVLLEGDDEAPTNHSSCSTRSLSTRHTTTSTVPPNSPSAALAMAASRSFVGNDDEDGSNDKAAAVEPEENVWFADEVGGEGEDELEEPVPHDEGEDMELEAPEQDPQFRSNDSKAVVVPEPNESNQVVQENAPVSPTSAPAAVTFQAPATSPYREVTVSLS